MRHILISVVQDSTFSIIVGAGISLWLASLAGIWKVATLLTTLLLEVKTLRRENKVNRLNIANIQNRFNIPQATEEDIPDDDV